MQRRYRFIEYGCSANCWDCGPRRTSFHLGTLGNRRPSRVLASKCRVFGDTKPIRETPARPHIIIRNTPSPQASVLRCQTTGARVVQVPGFPCAWRQPLPPQLCGHLQSSGRVGARCLRGGCRTLFLFLPVCAQLLWRRGPRCTQGTHRRLAVLSGVPAGWGQACARDRPVCAHSLMKPKTRYLLRCIVSTASGRMWALSICHLLNRCCVLEFQDSAVAPGCAHWSVCCSYAIQHASSRG